MRGINKKEFVRAKVNISVTPTGEWRIGRERAIVLGRALKVYPSVILFPDFDMGEAA